MPLRSRGEGVEYWLNNRGGRAMDHICTNSPFSHRTFLIHHPGCGADPFSLVSIHPPILLQSCPTKSNHCRGAMIRKSCTVPFIGRRRRRDVVHIVRLRVFISSYFHTYEPNKELLQLSYMMPHIDCHTLFIVLKRITGP